MDTPIYDQVLSELRARWEWERLWPSAADLEQADRDAPTKPRLELPPEMFKDWSTPARTSESAGRSLFRPSMVAVSQG